MLTIKDLTVTIKEEEKVILDDFSLTIKDGEVHAIMGPNGVGKTTLSKVIMRDKKYEVIKGELSFDEENLLDKTTDEVSRLGIYYLMQDPISIEGVTNSECIRTALNERMMEPVNLYTFIKEMNQNMEELKMDKKMMHRFVNQGFSGGEKKKNEVLQLKMLKPKFILLDELDSGLDVDSLKVVADNINQYRKENKDTSILIITHYSRILDLIKPDYVHQMVNGKIVKTGSLSFAKEIEKSGYFRVNEIGEEKDGE